jgi:hypothetical protein
VKFLVEKFQWHPPVDPGMDGRKQQREKLREEPLQCFFPGAVVVALGDGICGVEIG